MKENIKGRRIVRKHSLADYELEHAFSIIKSNMINLGFNVSKKDKEFWCDNLKNNLEKENFYFYLVYLDGEIVGFIELTNADNSFIVSEIQLDDKVKHTKIILEIIKYLLNSPELAHQNEVYFSILKNNSISNKTFSHLGGEIIFENEKKYKYIIKRELVESFISRLKNKVN